MQSGAAAVISSLLPASGVTANSSIAWSRLAYITDTFGPRFSGSAALEAALSWVVQTARDVDGLTVTEQRTQIPRWVRGAESGSWTTAAGPLTPFPRTKKLHMVGLGMSIGTPGGQPITAPGYVIFGASPDAANASLQLECEAIRAQRAIVLFNVPFTTYGATVGIRGIAGTIAAACGAQAALIRTVGAYSLQNPHTGYTMNASIPAAAVSLEDAAQMQRMWDRGQAFSITLQMDSYYDGLVDSRNVIIDYTGSTNPGEVVLVSGHGDSWDIAEGAMDDGGGFVTAWEAVRTLKALGLQSPRTVRAVVFVNEENGDHGGDQYAADLLNATYQGIANHSWALETDIGPFAPYGIGVGCAVGADCGAAQAQLALIGAALLGGIGSGNVSSGGGGTDVDPTCAQGVVCSGLNVLDPRLTSDSNNPCTADAMGVWGPPSYDAANPQLYDSQYFWVHHSEADTMERVDPRQLNHGAAALAVWAYAIALLPTLLPRDAPAPPAPSTSGGAASAGDGGLAAGAGGGVAGALALGLIIFLVRRQQKAAAAAAPDYSAVDA